MNRFKKNIPLCFLIVAIILAIAGNGRTQTIALADIETAIIEKDYHQAQQLSRSFLKVHSSDDQVLKVNYYLGLSSLYLGEYGPAKEIFSKLMTSQDRYVRDRAYLGMADVLYLEERYEEAEELCERLLKLSPKSDFLSLIYLKYARLNLRLAHWDEAYKALNTILERFPDSPEAPLAKQFLEEKQYYAVQVGAFLDNILAERLATELKEKGEYAYIVETLNPEGRKFYRVRVGKLGLLGEAQNLRSKLSQSGYPTQIYP